jgi:hypothetical protein
MNYCRRLFIFILAIAFILPVVPVAPASDGVEEDIPVWRVAWIAIPEVKVYVGDELRTARYHTYHTPGDPMPDPSYYPEKWFYDTAAKFKDYIEISTNHAVKIEITHITIENMPVFTSLSPYWIGFAARLPWEIREQYDIDSYDTWMAHWPFVDTSAPVSSEIHDVAFNAYPIGGTFSGANIAFGAQEIYLQSQRHEDHFMLVAIHEFLHTTEAWFRDVLRYPLPYNGPPNRFALHNPGYYGYGESYSDPSQVDWNFFRDWLSMNVPNPGYPDNGLPEFLGIPPEAWRRSPSKARLPAADGIVPSDAPGWFIDLSTETLHTPDNINPNDYAYNINNSKRWIRGLPDIPRMLNRPSHLLIADYDATTKKPVLGGKLIYFPAIEARPRVATRLRPNYLPQADPTGATPGAWVLSPRGRGEAVTENVEIALASGRVRSGDWAAMPETGVAVTGQRATYFVRTAPITEAGRYVPASRPYRVTAAAQQKEPRYSVRNDAVRIRANTYITIGGETELRSQAGNVSVSDVTGTVSLWMAATERRPASRVQELSMPGSSALLQTYNMTFPGEPPAGFFIAVCRLYIPAQVCNPRRRQAGRPAVPVQ